MKGVFFLSEAKILLLGFFRSLFKPLSEREGLRRVTIIFRA